MVERRYLPKSKQYEFSPNDTKHEFAQIRFAPLTGTEFEKKEYIYSNYKVRLTAVLLNESGTEIDGTESIRLHHLHECKDLPGDFSNGQ